MNEHKTRKETESVVCISGKVEVLLKTEGKMREAIQDGDDVLQNRLPN